MCPGRQGGAGVAALAQPSLLYLRVAHNGIGDDGGRTLGEAQLVGGWQLECPGNWFKWRGKGCATEAGVQGVGVTFLQTVEFYRPRK